MIVPVSLQTGGERTAQRRVRAFLEQVHHRLTDHAVLDTEQLEPRRVGIDHDAFLHLDDGVVRTLQHAVELAARVVRGFEGGVERLLRAERAQLALHHCLQPRLVGEGDHVAGAEGEALGHQRFIDRGGDQQHRHPRGELVAQRDRRSERLAIAPGVEQELGIELGERIAQVGQRRDPGAVRRLPGPAQHAVDRLGQIARGAEHDERNGARLGQGAPPRQVPCRGF